jgi:hypothetical protein
MHLRQIFMLDRIQGDQIGRIFAHSTAVLLKIFKSCLKFFGYLISAVKVTFLTKMGWATFEAI